MESRLDQIKEGRITADIAGFERGVESHEAVKMIRIKSVDHTLLIMEDYMPVLGEVDGSVTVCTGDEEKEYANIRGFYLHRHNHFSLVINRDGEFLEDHTLEGEQEKDV